MASSVLGVPKGSGWKKNSWITASKLRSFAFVERAPKTAYCFLIGVEGQPFSAADVTSRGLLPGPCIPHPHPRPKYNIAFATTRLFLGPYASTLKMPSLEPLPETSANIPPFPPPSLFSILPEIYLLISRIELLQQNAGAALPTTPGENSSVAPITLQELPAAIQPIKTQILKAKAAVQSLPDVELTVEEQGVEIKALEVKIAGLRRRLALLGSRAGQGIKGQDVAMTGVEG
jgi:hypothetical protein